MNELRNKTNKPAEGGAVNETLENTVYSCRQTVFLIQNLGDRLSDSRLCQAGSGCPLSGRHHPDGTAQFLPSNHQNNAFSHDRGAEWRAGEVSDAAFTGSLLMKHHHLKE